jgi:hypothetical protein
VLRDCGQDVNGEAIGFREVASDEVSSRFHEGANEVNITRETIQLGNYQRRLMQATEPETSDEMSEPTPALGSERL